MTLTLMPNWLKKRAELTPERLALSFKGQRFTFAQLDQTARRISAKLADLKLGRGEQVGLLMQNGVHFVEMIHALEYLGLTMVLLNTRLAADELSWQIKDANVSLLIYDGPNESKVHEMANGGEVPPTISWDELVSLPEQNVVLRHEVSLDDLHSIIYTSGTTGYPKGVMLTYGNHWWSAVGSALNLGLQPNDRWLAVVPCFHVSGLSILMRSIIYGIEVVLHDYFEPDQVNKAISQDGITIISVVSTMLTKMLDSLGTANYPKSLRCILIGGGPVPLSLLKWCKAKGMPVYQTYGMTETASQLATLGPEVMMDKLGSAGKPLFPAELRIANEGQSLAPGKVGEILVKGANVTKGYYNRPRETSQTIRDGWLYTGDLGYLDEDGFLYVLDRRSDLIISGGENIYPAEIEAVLNSYEGVALAGVVGKEDKTWGQVPVAFVQLKRGCQVTEDELLTFCQERLAKYKVPRSIYILPEMPLNAANKVQRAELKKVSARNES